MNLQNMRSREKGFGTLAVVVVIALVAALGGFYLYQRNTTKMKVATMENQSMSPTVSPSGPEPSPMVTGVTSPTDTSNTAIDKDTQNINTQINALNSDSVNIDNGLNATPENLQ